MTKSQELLFELLLISTGARKTLSHPYTDKEWEEAYSLAEEQTVSGVLLDALERLQQNLNPNPNEGKGMLPSKLLLLQWIGSCQMIEAETKKLEEAQRRR